MMLKYLLVSIAIVSSTFSFAQKELLIPYRLGNVWGLADTNIRVVVAPQYDSVTANYSDPNGYYKVVQKGKYGVITSSSVVIPPSLNAVHFRYGFIVHTFSGNANETITYAQYYNKYGALLFPDTVRYVRRLKQIGGYYLYTVIGKDKMKSVIALNQKSQTVNCWLLKNKAYQYVYATRSGDKLIVYGERYDNGLDVFEVSSEDSDELSIKQLSEEEIGDIVETEEIYYDEAIEMEPDYDSPYGKYGEIHISTTGRDYLIVNKAPEKSRRRYYYGRTREVDDTIGGGQIPSKRFAIVSYNTLADSISNDNFIYKTPNMYRGGTGRTESFIQYTSKKKIGMITAFAHIPASFDTIYPMAANSGTAPRFIVGQKQSKKGPMRYGILSIYGDTIVPIAQKNIALNVNRYRRYSPVVAGYILTNETGKQSYVKSSG